MSTHFADRLIAAIEAKGAPVCVGLDPVYANLPAEVTGQTGAGGAQDVEAALAAIREFCRGVIRIVSPIVPAVKINSAFFERYHADGVRTYFDLVTEAAAANLIVIGDVKRADVGHSSVLYAQAQLGNPDPPKHHGQVAPDAVTVNAYFGIDGIKPFLDIAREQSKGVFALVQTSNESAVEVQGLTLSDGGTVCERVAQLVNTWAGDDGLIGACGYSALGAVVSPSDDASTQRLRAAMPNCIFLVPGFGSQGKTVEQIRHCFKPDGTGALINASRSVIYAHQNPKYRELCGGRWQECVEHACRDFAATVKSILPG